MNDLQNENVNVGDQRRVANATGMILAKGMARYVKIRFIAKANICIFANIIKYFCASAHQKRNSRLFLQQKESTSMRAHCTTRVHISPSKGVKNVSLCRRLHRQVCVHACVRARTDMSDMQMHTHMYKTLLSECAHRWLYECMIYMQATERLRDPSGSFSRVHIMRSHFILHPLLFSRNLSVIVCVRIMSAEADGATQREEKNF